ncbi:MAG: anhydro-N-acetylmuramic acid kinase [Planctomycetota bacterium]
MSRTFAHLLERAAGADGLVVAGCLSGTSMDGIDVALARGWLRGTQPTVELLAARTVPFEPALGERLARAASGAPSTAREFALLDRDLGSAIAAAVAGSAAEAGVTVDLVASHGQTLGHHDGESASEPDGGAPWTLQVGDPDRIAEVLGAAVAFDFRRSDVAGGGEGAPLVPFVDGALFARAPRPAAVLNLGGIANLTWLGLAAEAQEEHRAGFDVGPANLWLDGFARRLLELPYDPGGAAAARGSVDERLAMQWLAEPFYRRAPPKSTGRDTFDASWIEARLAEGAGRSAADLLATASAVVARSVADAARRWLPGGPPVWIVAGGGWHHRPLVAELERATGLPAQPADRFGVPVDAREALAFALLGLLTLGEVPVAVAAVTGGGRPRVLGRLVPARP